VRQLSVILSIVIAYTVSSIYLEMTLFLFNPLLKTILSFIYCLIWIGPLLYLWWKAKIQENQVIPILVLFLAILYVSPLVNIPVPVGRFFPDVDFTAAKVLYSSTGHFFNDPVTSYPTIYPPVYHIIVGSIMRLLGSNNSWYVLSRFHIGMMIGMFLSVYFLARWWFNPRVGLLSVLFMGAIFDMPNWSGMFFPTPFLLGLTFMVNSLTLTYLALQGRKWSFYPAGLVTGLAITTWPAFLPVAVILIAVIFYSQNNRTKSISNPLKFALACLVLPLLIWVPQYILLSRQHLMGHGEYGLWKGIPALGWVADLILRFFTLGGFDNKEHGVTALFGINYIVCIGLAIWGFRSLEKGTLLKKFSGLFTVLILLCIPVIHYVFSFMYSRRVQVLFSILIVISAVYYLITHFIKKYKFLGLALVVWIAVFANGWNVYMGHKYVVETEERYETWKKYATGALGFIQSHAKSGEYIFATDNTYRFVIIGNALFFNLQAHRSGNYYSLNPDLAKELADHYDDILLSSDFDLIKRVLSYHGIRYVLVREGEQKLYPGLKQLYDKCDMGYRDENYTVLKCDATP
jgi:4-amino-4-deoxy-L-arabinose transferase-like glycosyltransferase